MDLFLNEQNKTLFNDEKIVVFCERKGKHYNTYIVGWNLTDEEIKNNLETMKKKFGCGGAIKNIIYDGKNNIQAIYLQGNFPVKVGEHLKLLNIKNYIIKELIN